jgi:hypothetical protein
MVIIPYHKVTVHVHCPSCLILIALYLLSIWNAHNYCIHSISMTKIEFHNVDLSISPVQSSPVLYPRQYLSVQRDEINRFSANRAMMEHSVTTLHFDASAHFIKLAQTHTMLTSISWVYLHYTSGLWKICSFFPLFILKATKTPTDPAILQFKPF